MDVEIALALGPDPDASQDFGPPQVRPYIELGVTTHRARPTQDRIPPQLELDSLFGIAIEIIFRNLN